MRIKDLIERLSVFPENWDIHIRTTNNDMTQPLTQKLMQVIEPFDDRGGRNVREQPILLLTAFIKDDDNA